MLQQGHGAGPGPQPRPVRDALALPRLGNWGIKIMLVVGHRDAADVDGRSCYRGGRGEHVAQDVRTHGCVCLFLRCGVAASVCRVLLDLQPVRLSERCTVISAAVKPNGLGFANFLVTGMADDRETMACALCVPQDSPRAARFLLASVLLLQYLAAYEQEETIYGRAEPNTLR